MKNVSRFFLLLLLLNGQVVAQDFTSSVYFDRGKWTLTPAATRRLDSLSAFLKTKNNVRIEITGYTDSDGSDSANYSLGEKRAKTVRDFFVLDRALKAALIRSYSEGESAQQQPNTSPEGKAANRRVTIRGFKNWSEPVPISEPQPLNPPVNIPQLQTATQENGVILESTADVVATGVGPVKLILNTDEMEAANITTESDDGLLASSVMWCFSDGNRPCNKNITVNVLIPVPIRSSCPAKLAGTYESLNDSFGVRWQVKPDSVPLVVRDGRSYYSVTRSPGCGSPCGNKDCPKSRAAAAFELKSRKLTITEVKVIYPVSNALSRGKPGQKNRWIAPVMPAAEDEALVGIKVKNKKGKEFYLRQPLKSCKRLKPGTQVFLFSRKDFLKQQ